MGIVIIFFLIAILAVYGIYSNFKRKNNLAVIFSVLTAGVFGWFAVATAFFDGLLK
ncbi:MAG: hypothetical protein K0S34_369 [Bacillales bacterium]|jgi:hypothetical protein|nr:hypothetical protein [Bacillales bacterium]